MVQAFDALITFTQQTVAVSSARIYGQTFALWRAWCADNGVNPLDLRPALATMQAAPRHARSETTLRYAQARKTLKLRYG